MIWQTVYWRVWDPVYDPLSKLRRPGKRPKPILINELAINLGA